MDKIAEIESAEKDFVQRKFVLLQDGNPLYGVLIRIEGLDKKQPVAQAVEGKVIDCPAFSAYFIAA